MNELDERLQQLADSVVLPATTPHDDLGRGRARRRHRNLGAAGAALTTAAVIGTSVVLLAGGTGQPGSAPDVAVSPAAGGPGDASGVQTDAPAHLAERAEVRRLTGEAALGDVLERTSDARRLEQALDGYRDVLRDDLDPAGTRIQTGPITNQQAGQDSLGTKLAWNGGGMLEIAVGRSLEGVQFFCDGACSRQTVAGARKALVLTSPGSISVAVFQDDGDIVALTADTSFGNNGTSTNSLGLTVDQLLTAAADPRLDLPDGVGASLDSPGTR